MCENHIRYKPKNVYLCSVYRVWATKWNEETGYLHTEIVSRTLYFYVRDMYVYSLDAVFVDAYQRLGRQGGRNECVG